MLHTKFHSIEQFLTTPSLGDALSLLEEEVDAPWLLCQLSTVARNFPLNGERLSLALLARMIAVASPEEKFTIYEIAKRALKFEPKFAEIIFEIEKWETEG